MKKYKLFLYLKQVFQTLIRLKRNKGILFLNIIQNSLKLIRLKRNKRSFFYLSLTLLGASWFFVHQHSKKDTKFLSPLSRNDTRSRNDTKLSLLKDSPNETSRSSASSQPDTPPKTENVKNSNLSSASSQPDTPPKTENAENSNLSSASSQPDTPPKTENAENSNLSSASSQPDTPPKTENVKNSNLSSASSQPDTPLQKQISKDSTLKKRLVIASKVFTENIILGELLALILEENYGFKVIRKFNMGGTKLIFDALIAEGVDIYPEYTGTGYAMILKESEKLNPEETYKFVKDRFLKKYQLVWSPPLGFENTYILAVRENDSRFKNISLTSELEGLSLPLRLAADHEFTERKDGWSLFSKQYQLHLKNKALLSMNSALMYSAIDNKKVDIIMAYSTDGRIKNYQLKTLKDDKNFFPSYLASYLTRKNILETYPEVKKTFKLLENQISQEEMIELNSQVDQLKKGISQTAQSFLIQKGILKTKPLKETSNNLISYYFQKRAYILKIFIEHLILIFTALILALIVSLPLSIWAVYNSRVEKTLFFLVNNLQTIPSIALLGALVPILGIGFAPAVTALFIYSLLPLVRNSFEGIKNIDNSYIEISAGLGLTKRQIVRYVQIPLALPVIIAGVRTSVVLLVGTATLAAFIGAGALGDPIFRGIATLDSRLIFMGAVPACLLAILLDKLFSILEQRLISKGLKKKRKIDPLLI